jgi:hypothetical protein
MSLKSALTLASKIMMVGSVGIVCFLGACTKLQNMAGGIEGGNTVGTVSGTIADSAGIPLANVRVRLLPSMYNPVNDPMVPDSLMDTTDLTGHYAISVTHRGSFNIEIAGIDNGYRSLVRGIMLSKDDSMLVQNAIARLPGVIKVVLPSNIDLLHGYFYIPGTTIFSLLSNATGAAVLESIPAEVNLSIYYAVNDGAAPPQLVRDSVVVAPGGNSTIAYVGWTHAKRLVLNTTATGAGIAGMVTGFPVLIRLSSSNFDFSAAMSHGEDIRFTKSDNTPLPYEIERWDGANGQAEMWVRVDTVYGNNGSQHIVLYWGASTVGSTGSPQGSATQSLSNSAAVFDTGSGFQGVWHLNQPTGSLEKDATYNHFDGTPSDTAPSVAPGIIGNAQEFNGVSNSLHMLGTSSSKLNFPENGHYSLSAWVFADTLVDSTTHVIAGKGHEQYFMKLYWGGQHWEFTEYHDKTGWQVSSYSPAQAKVWKYLVGVRQGTDQYLYLDGELVSSAYGTAASSIARNTTDDFLIGKYQRSADYTGEGFSWFDGAIDEVRISNVSRSADWIKLCYMNQKETDALVKFK